MTSLQRRPGVPQGQMLRSPVSPTPQYDAYGPQLGYLSENIHRLLTERECSIFDRGLADYHRRRNVRSFVECLSLVLNTNQKRQLLLPIRDSYIKPSDLVKFNQLVQDHGIATSLKRKKKEEEKAKSGSSGVRRLEVRRDSNGDWGFSIRGGSEHGIGVFVSWVEPTSGAHKSGLQVGDQILKANDVSFENISHCEAVKMLKGCKKVSLWALSRGRVPSSRMTHKVYRWMSPEGRSVSPPPDPFDLQDQTSIGERGVMNEADERKVTMVVEDGQELGISIRGGAEHGLGIYVSVVEEDSVADNYGLKPGDQLLEVNGVNFLSIIHSDAANALRAQRCMVMRVKDVGKIPHSRITTYGQTEWKEQANKSSNNSQMSSPPVFKPGMGTQVMHDKQQTGSIQGRGIINEVARSVLNTEELNTFSYYIEQYDQHGLSVGDLVAPLLDLLNTPEKLQLLSEVRGLIKAHDLQHFNELTVHKEISAKKGGSRPDGSSKPTSPIEMNRTPNTHNGSEEFILSPLTSTAHGDMPLPHESGDLSSEEGGRDRVPQKLSPQRPGPKGTFHVPPPPGHQATSTPDGRSSSDPQTALTHTLQERRQYMRDGTKDQSMEDTWDGQWNNSSIMHSQAGADMIDGAADISEIEAKVRSQTEAQLREEFGAEQRKLMEEQQRLLEQEKQEKEMTLRREREKFQRELTEQEERIKAEIEGKLRIESEEKMQRKLEERERALAEEYSKRSASQLEQTDFEEQVKQIEERTKMELEEKIWKEAEEQLRIEFDAKIEEEKTKFQSEASKTKSPVATPNKEAESHLRKELEQKFKKEYDEKIRREREKMRQQQQDDKRRREGAERAKRQGEVARLEAEEQARIENEERIRKEAETAAKAEYEVRLQKETEKRAKLAEEVKARREADERREAEQRKGNKVTSVQQQQQQARYEEPEVEEESVSEEEDLPDTEPMHTGPVSGEEEAMLDTQRRRRQTEERQRQREERQREEQERRANNEAFNKQEEERQKKLEMQRKREENIRRREEERKQKESDARRKREQQKGSHTSTHTKPKINEEEIQKARKSTTKSTSTSRSKTRSDDSEGKPQKTKQQLIEEERYRAEEKLQKRLKKAQEKKQAEEEAAAAATGEGQSFGGYENLYGHIFNVTITKICKKLGIAIDGGANTKQKAVIIREISAEGCAAQTGEGLRVGQQILSVGGHSLYNLRHKDVVLTIKSSFEGPLEKKLELVVLDQA